MDVNTKISAADVKLVDKAVSQPLPQAEKQHPRESVVSPAKAVEQVPLAQLEQELQETNSRLNANGQGILFSLDKDTNSSVLKLVDKSTDEVIKQYPSEDSLRIMKNIQRFLDSAHEAKGFGKEGLTGSLLSEII